MDLVIMAAGLGSRFGGLKQLTPIDEQNNFIIDYSIYDAIKVGFTHVVFIIKENIFEEFKQTIGNRIAKYVDVDYVFQNNDSFKDKYDIPTSRTKPFGTGHAILCAKSAIRGDFAVINADDYYGRDALQSAYNFLLNNNDEQTYALIGYEAKNTINESGSVKRGICQHIDGFLTGLNESSIEYNDENSLKATSLIDNKEFIIKNNQLVSMNLFAFKKSFLNYLDKHFEDFLESNKNNLASCEFFLPSVVSNLIQDKKIKTKLLSTTSKWFGITYKEDLEVVINKIIDMKNQNIYPKILWN